MKKVFRSAELVTSSGQGLCPPVLGLGALSVCLVSCPTSLHCELERDARGLTFDFLTGCVGLTELVEGVPVLKSHQCATISDARPASYGRAPKTTPHRPSSGGTEKTARDPKPTRENDQQDWRVLGFTTWCVSTPRIHPSVNQELQSRTVGVLPGPLASDLAGSCLALRALTIAGSCLVQRPLTTLGLVWPSRF